MGEEEEDGGLGRSQARVATAEPAGCRRPPPRSGRFWTLSWKGGG